MPRHKKIFISLIFFLQLGGPHAFSSVKDSLAFINDVKKFAFKETDFDMIGDFYSQWTTVEKPYVYVYISLPDSIKKPATLRQPYFFYGTDEEEAIKEANKYSEKTYHAFCYKTYANSSAMLNKHLLSYSNEAIAFIVFHELIHNYLGQKHIKIPYEYNEALCDVIGNYGALQYSRSTKNLDLAMVKRQIKRNEKIYESLNKTISSINQNPKKTAELNTRCYKTLHSILKKANLFQKDRFDYTVNNGFLLKNEYYSKHYFLLKKVYLKQKSLKAFLKIMETLPEKGSDCEAYLQKFT